MKLTVRKQDLQEELALTQGVVEAKATIPILSHLLLRADRDGLQLMATDLEIGLHSRFAADVTSPGSAAIPAKKLHEIVRALACDVISLETTANGWVSVEGGSFRGRVVALPDEDFPTQPEFPVAGVSVNLPLTLLQQMLSRVIFAVTTENTRFSINGALVKIGPSALTVVATDGHRLAHVTRPMDLGARDPISVLVPRKALTELTRIRAKDENDEVELAAERNHVFFKSRGRVLHSRTLEGSFPNYEKVIPVDHDKIARIGREALSSVLTRVAILTNETSRMVTLAFSDGSLTISTNNPNMGEASEQLSIEHSGGDVRIGLNYEYLLQFLQAVDCESIEFHLKDSTSQALLKPIGGSSLQYSYVIMPMRLS